MSEFSMNILLVIGSMSASLALGLIILQFVIWAIFGLTEEENNRPLFSNFHHRHATYKDDLILKGLQPHAGHEARHKKLVEIFKNERDRAMIERAIKNAVRIIEEVEKKI